MPTASTNSNAVVATDLPEIESTEDIKEQEHTPSTDIEMLHNHTCPMELSDDVRNSNEEIPTIVVDSVVVVVGDNIYVDDVCIQSNVVIEEQEPANDDIGKITCTCAFK